MKKTLLLFLPLIFPCLLYAQTEPANYKVAVSNFVGQFNQGDSEGIFNKFNAKMQSVLTLDKTKATMNQLKAQLGDLESTEFKSYSANIALYKAAFTNGVFGLKISLDSDNKMGGLLVQPYQEEKELTVDATLVETPISQSLDDASLSGSLILPKNSIAKIPVLLIIAGSGPTDRNGNSTGLISANSYFLLAEALGKAGVATLRYDKRAIGKSTSAKTEADTRFDDFVKDAAALIKLLKNDQRFSKVIVLGHSEGSLIGMVAVEKEAASAFISVAGAGERADKIIATQTKAQNPQFFAAYSAKLDSLAQGLTVSGESNNPLFRPSVQPYLISWFKYNPQTEVKKLKVPVQIIQGTTDLQVSVADAQNLKKAKPSASLVLIEGMNHALKQAPADREKNLATYKNPNLPIDPKLVDAVVAFVNQVK